MTEEMNRVKPAPGSNPGKNKIKPQVLNWGSMKCSEKGASTPVEQSITKLCTASNKKAKDGRKSHFQLSAIKK